MTYKQRRKRGTLDAVHVHPRFYASINHGRKLHRDVFFRQFKRIVAICLAIACFVKVASMASQIPFLVHLPLLWVNLAIIIWMFLKVRRTAANMSKFKRFEKLKKTSVIYTAKQK